MTDESPEYDIFLSYARTDNRENDRYVEKLAQTLRSIYRAQTGRELRIFLDLDEIPTAEIWERRIRLALRRSAIMISVLSPAYFNSAWCGREWDAFTRMSQERSITYGITPYLKLIFPITLRRWTTDDQLSPDRRRRVRQAQALQYVDFADVSPGTEQFAHLVTRLISDLTDVLDKLEATAPGHSIWPDLALPAASAASAESPMVTTRRAQDRFQFVRVLADAINVTIIGITNEKLAEFLSGALELKQRRLGPAAFWESLRIVFLREDLLGLVNDQIEALQPRSSDTFRARKVRAKAGKRAVVSFLIRQDHPERWSLHEYEYFLPFVGVLFGMADGTNLVQIAMPRPRQSVSDALYFEFVDSADQYFGNGFRDVIADSREDNEVVLVGTPDDDSHFHVNGARFRRSALREGQNAQEWLPSVTVVTWTIRNGRKTPVLQVRTEENSTHYLHHLSHISGYINESDLVLADSEAHWSDGSSNVLPIGAARNAATRELIDQLNFSAREEELQLFGVCRFNNYDRENLFFYVFSLQLPAIHQYPESSQIRAWGLPELISLHEYQVLSKAAELLRVEDLSSAQRTDGARILACQLTLHGQLQLGQRIVRAAQRSTSALPDGLSKLAAQHAVQVRLEGRQTTLSGLAEIHYREFFSTLLPLYAQVGVSGAARAVDGLQRIDGGRDALAQLMEAYGDDELLSSLPFDL